VGHFDSNKLMMSSIIHSRSATPAATAGVVPSVLWTRQKLREALGEKRRLCLGAIREAIYPWPFLVEIRLRRMKC